MKKGLALADLVFSFLYSSIFCIFFTILLFGCNGDPIEQNQVPTATITSPAGGGEYNEGNIIVFNGYGVDPDIWDLNLSGGSLVWNSSLDGQFGTGTAFTTNSLSVGVHTITLTVYDSAGASGTTAIFITILEEGITPEPSENTSPNAEISSPSWGSDYNVGDTIVFDGTGTDTEDGNLTGASLVWTSSIDGEIGTGSLLTLDNLSEGDHRITFTVTDSQGATNSDVTSITINP